MTDAAREAHNKYVREWSAKNRDKVRASQARYWEKRAAEAAAEAAANAAACPPEVEA